MKKMLAVAAILMLVPFTAFGMQMMADTALEDVTGQAGVSIDVDNVQLDFAMDYLAWGDADATNDAGDDLKSWVGIAGLEMTNIVIDRLGVGSSAITPIAGALDLTVYGGATAASGPQIVTGTTERYFDATSDFSYLTIDVGLCPVPTAVSAATGASYTSHTAVVIGIPTLSIYVGEIADMDIALGTGALDAAPSLTEIMGTLAVGGMQVDLKAGTVFIMAH